MDKGLAPGYIRQTYDGLLFPHHMTCPVNVDPGVTPGVEPDITLKDASTSGVIAAWAAMLAVIKVFFPSSVHFGLAEIHTVDATTGEDQFIFAWNAGVVGTAGGSQVVAGEAVFSFKTSIGSAYKLYLMESVTPVNLRLLPPYVDTPNVNLSDFVVGSSSPVYGRKNAYPFVPVSMVSKTNDKLRAQHGLA
jgi:hypothetical protein